MMQEIRTIRDETIRVDFNAIVQHFPAGLEDSGIERLNRAAQVSGFGHPFRDSDDIDTTRSKLDGMLKDEVFRMGFVEFFSTQLPRMQQAIERVSQQQQNAARPGLISSMVGTAFSMLRAPRFRPTS